jgi:restriction system protein
MPSTKELLNATLKGLMSLGGHASNQQLLNWVIDNLELSDEQISAIRSGNRTELEYRLAWARTAAKKKGLIERSGPSNWKLP